MIYRTYLHRWYFNLCFKFNLHLKRSIDNIIADAQENSVRRILTIDDFIFLAWSILSNAVRGLPLHGRDHRSAGMLGTALLSPALHSPTRNLKTSSIWKPTIHRAAYMSSRSRLEAVKSWVHTRQTNRQGRLILPASVNWFQSSHLNIKPSPAGGCQGNV